MTADDGSDAAGDEFERKLEDGWQALERGDRVIARRIADEAVKEEDGASPARAADRLAPALLLQAACVREEGNHDQALPLLRRAVKADPEWCTPELWLAELLAMQPETTAEARRHAARALDLADEEPEYLSALALKAGLEAELGEVDEAKATLADLPPADVSLGDATLALEIAELWLAIGEPAQARDRLLTLTGSEPQLADGWYTLGIACEELGDEAAMRAAWKKAWQLDSRADDADLAVRIDERELGAVAESALGELPSRARALLRDVPIVIAELPAEADVDSGLDPRVLGLFAGTPHPEMPHVGGQPDLTQIVLFRRNLERAAGSEDELRREIRTTLLHETGHFFGMDEADLEGVGLD
ncbi:MAG TPA: metallopeptidase family protein [Polyangia bacterium]|nr:metallopeptidase family protein [Polyangia bacterium]